MTKCQLTQNYYRELLVGLLVCFLFLVMNGGGGEWTGRHWMTKFWPTPIPRLFSGNKFSKTKTDTFFLRPNSPKLILFSETKISETKTKTFFRGHFCTIASYFVNGGMTSIYIDIGGIHPTSNRQTPTDHSSHFIAYYDISVPKSKFLESDLHVESKSERN